MGKGDRELKLWLRTMTEWQAVNGISLPSKCPCPNPWDIWTLPYVAKMLAYGRWDYWARRLSWMIEESTTGVLPRGRKREIPHREEKAMWRQRQNLKWCSHQPRNVGSHQKLEEARNRFSPEFLSWSTAQLTLILSQGHWFWTLTSRTAREYITVVLSHHVFGNLLQWPQETNIHINKLHTC